MNILNKDFQELGSALAITDAVKRQVAYSAVIIAYIENNEQTDKVATLDFFYALNEVTVMDKETFINLFNKFIEFGKNPYKRSNSILSFNDIISINSILGSGLIDNINKDIQLFNTVLVIAKRVLR